MKVQNGDTILTGMAEVSVDKLIALEKSVNDKDQLVGALREQIKGLIVKVEEVKADATAKQAKVLIQKGGPGKKSSSFRCSCGYWYDAITYQNCPSCGIASPGDETKEYKNLDDVIENIRKEEANKLGVDLVEYEKKINTLTLANLKDKNTRDFEVAELTEKLKQEKKEKESDIQLAKEKIRKHMTTLIDGLNEEVDELKDTLSKVKKDKSDEAVEANRKQEIIDLKERITELETANENPLGLGWFKGLIYNWLKVDTKVRVQAERDELEKKERVTEISNNYPNSNRFWIPDWMW